MNTIQHLAAQIGMMPSKLQYPSGADQGRDCGARSTYFGFDLLLTFPYYQGSNAGQPIQNPLATP
jgi:hypothetical protein